MRVKGRWIGLGKYGNAESKALYDRKLSEWLAAGRELPPEPESSGVLIVDEAIARYWAGHVVTYCRDPDGNPTPEQHHLKQALSVVRRLYGSEPLESFGPVRLRATREAMVKDGWSRRHINQQVGRVKRWVRWCVGNELVEPRVLQGVQAIAGLRQGKTEARETDPVGPVADEHVQAIEPFVSRQVWALIQMQQLTGCRPGEAVIMRGCDIDMTSGGDLWEYRPAKHKGQHRGRERVIPLGPRARAVIQPFLRPGYLFSPKDADAERRERLHAARRTPMSCGNSPGTNKSRSPKKSPRDHYDVAAYRRAITLGCDRADAEARKQLPARKRAKLNETRLVPRWHPHQLRHSVATRIRRMYGVEAAQMTLGHRGIGTTELYAEKNLEAARDIMRKIG